LQPLALACRVLLPKRDLLQGLHTIAEDCALGDVEVM